MQVLNHLKAFTQSQWKYSLSESLSWMLWCGADYVVCEREGNSMKWHFGIKGPQWTASFSTLLPSLSQQGQGRHCSCGRDNSLCIESNQKEGRAPCSDSGACSYTNGQNERRWKALLKLLLEGRYLAFCWVDEQVVSPLAGSGGWDSGMNMEVW